MMISRIAMAAAGGVELEDKPRLIDQIVADSNEGESPEESATKRGGSMRRRRAASSPQAPRGPPGDDLETVLGDQVIFSIADLAKFARRSPATIFRLLRLGQLDCVQISGSRVFTRAIVLDFLRNGTRSSEAA
jgi:hypothetical protein